MARVKELKTLSIQEAMDNLAAVVGIDLEHPPRLGIIQHHRLITDVDQVGPHEVVWLSGEGSEGILEILDMTFYTIHQHLIHLLESTEINWDDQKVRKGIQAMVAIATEAAHKMDQYLEFRLGKAQKKKVEDRIPYQDLQYFYQHRFTKKIKGGEDSWTKDWNDNEQAPVLDLSKTGLKDFETVRRDLEYELFSIRSEEGKPYFNAALLRNIKLVCFDAGKEISFEEDPLLRVRAMEDRDLQASAHQILDDCMIPIEDFYKLAHKLKDVALAQHLSMGLTALFLASNQRNLIQNTSGKSSLQYFHDFHMFLRSSMNSDEYNKYIAYPPEAADKTAQLLLFLTHSLCRSFFYRLGGVKTESIGLIHRCMRKGEELDKKSAIKGDTIWNQLLIDDEKFRALLVQFPNGPLFKILDLIRDEDPESLTFDPLFQENLPQQLFEINLRGQKISLLRLPCPIRQSLINKVSIVEEFRGFLRSYAAVKEKTRKKHLLINLQDRTSWQEYTRSNSMEILQKNAEFSEQLSVVTLPKSTDFYHQNSEYLNCNTAAEFLDLFKEQLAAPEECGFFFPSQIPAKELQKFTASALPFIHQSFFNGKSNLTRRNREDFIEIYYQLLVLKIIDWIKPDSLSFTCKDAIDTGAAATATFFGFLHLLSGDLSKEIDFFRWLLYTPALFIRERAIDPERLGRAISALERMDGEITEKGTKIEKGLADLYDGQFIKTLSVKHF